jgi:hypothetical protein
MEFTRQKFAGICYNLSYSPGARVRQGKLTGDVGLTSSSPKKSQPPMRNNDKTSAIDYGGYRSTFDMIFSPMVRSLTSHDRHRV